jgi:hypothetical protein
MSAISLTINGTDRSALVDWQSLKKSEILTYQPDSLEFLIRNYPSKTYRPALGDEVILSTIIPTSYSNSGGSGNRTALITISQSASNILLPQNSGTLNNYINGVTSEAKLYWTNVAVAGRYLRFDFGTSKLITEVTFYNQPYSTTLGTWKWQGSNDAISWTDVSSSFALADSTVVDTSMSANTTGYRYYQLLGVSGTVSNTPDAYEITFKIDDYNPTKIFGGYVISTDDTIDGLLKYFNVTCKDYTQILDRLLVSANYTNQTVNYIIADILSRFVTGVTGANVNANITIGTVSFNYLSVSQCLTKLTQLIGGGFDWYIDYNKDVHFFATAGVAAPFQLTDTSANFHFGTLEIQQDTSQLRNFVTVRGGNAIGTAVDNKQIADGTQRVFFVGYRLTSFAALKALAASPTSFASLTVGNDGVDDPTTKNCLYNPDKGLLIFPDATKPAVGDVIEYTGVPSFPIIVQAQNAYSVATYGQFQSVIVDSTITSKDAATRRANAELVQYGLPITTGSFTTHTDGLLTGQTLTINSSVRGINASYKINQITTTLKTPSPTTAELVYNVQFVSTVDVSLVDVLNKLLVTDPANQIQVGSNEIIEIVYSFDESFTLSDSVNTPTTSSPPYKYGTAKYNLSTYS